MTSFAYEDWSDRRARDNPRPGLPLWVALSVAAHALLLLGLLATRDQEPLTLADRAVRDRPPVEVAMTPLQRLVAPMPDEEVQTDRPDNTLPPPVRKLDDAGELRARPDSPTHLGLEAIDLKAMKRLQQANQQKQDLTLPGMGDSWTTCSLMSPERRVMEPACDGLMLQLARRRDGGLTATLRAPDGDTLRAIQKFERDREAERAAVARDEGGAARDRSYRSEGDDYFGPRPWE